VKWTGGKINSSTTREKNKKIIFEYYWSGRWVLYRTTRI